MGALLGRLAQGCSPAGSAAQLAVTLKEAEAL
jgi:hypothetical protein